MAGVRFDFARVGRPESDEALLLRRVRRRLAQQVVIVTSAVRLFVVQTGVALVAVAGERLVG